jgi:asparagine synthase (glutamine-hydrolysing)
VLRELMKDKLPAEIMRRPKIGFDIPVHDWLRGVLCPLLLDTISEDAVRASGLFHWTGVEKILADHLDRRANLGYHLWGLMILLLWMKEWKIAPPLPVEDMTSLNTPAFAFDQVGSL